MNNENRGFGDSKSFDQNWKLRKEALYNHWTPSKPENQIQLAFSQHWSLFSKILKENGITSGKSLEVGCGRASISSYFSQNNFDVTCLDLSAEVISLAQEIFRKNGHKGNFVVGDALDLPFEDKSFDVVVSIGLLEHFEDIYRPISEQYRILKDGGVFLGYIVPENKLNIQKDYEWINFILKTFSKNEENSDQKKVDIFRSDYGSERYLPVLKELGMKDIKASGVYPLPMISHSIDFPFSLNQPDIEKILVGHFANMLANNTNNDHPWLCDEKFGQAFLVWGRK